MRKVALLAVLAASLSASASSLPAPTPSPITLQWDAGVITSGETATAGYDAFRSIGGGAWSQINTAEIGVTEYADSTAPLGPCSYYVIAVDSSGNQSAASNTATVMVPAQIAAGTLAGSTT